MFIKFFFEKKLPNKFLFVKLYYIMINFLKKNIYFFGILLFAVLAVVITFQHNIGLIIDCGREAYYPQEILNGKVLYKDLFTIYAPFAYLFNAFLYKIFGINLNVLCAAGSVCAISIIAGIFLITEKLLNSKIAFCISIFAIVIGIFPVHVFNYVFPYAFSMTYGLAAFVFSLLFLICYINKKSNIYVYLSLFLAGLSVCCKYEFLPYLFVYVPVFLRLKPNFNVIFKGLLSFGLIPEMCFAFLFAKGLTLHALINSINIILNMSNTQTLKYFYMHSGVFPHKFTVILVISTFLALFVPFFVYITPILFKNKIKNRIVPVICTYTAFCLMILFKNGLAYDIFFSMTIVLFFAAFANYKKLLENLSLFVVVISVLLISIKVFWGILLNSYGIYYLPFIIIAIAFIFKDRFTEEEWNHIAFYVLVLAFLIGFNNLSLISAKKTVISTLKGKIFVEKKYETTNQLLDFIQKNTAKNDKIVIFPEGMMINFLSERKTDDFYNSFLPLYEETFGVGNFREHFEKNMPEYIIFNSWNSSDYYFSIICEDYGFDFCEFVKKNYNEKIKLSGDFSYIIFKKK